MADDITAPIHLPGDYSIVRTLEAFKQVLGEKEVVYLTLNDRTGLTVYAKGNHEISVDDGRPGPKHAMNAKLVEDILQQAGVSSRLIGKMKRMTARSRRGYHYLIWMPIQPIPITLMDHLLGRRRQEWQLIATEL
jgi:hypothetical protein